MLSFGLSACVETPETHDLSVTPHEHSWSTEWTKNDVYHWHAPLCVDTGEVKNRAEHSFVNGVCLCGFTTEKTHEHSWSTEWTKNEAYHWHAPLCADTAEIKDRAEHDFVNGKCSECEFEKIIPHEHSWSTEWSKNDMYHWHAPLCADTAEIKDRAEHNFVNGKCSECKHEKVIPHDHSWSKEWSDDANFHWHAPLCNDINEVKDKELHSFGTVNGEKVYICLVCGYKRFNDVGEKYYTVVKPVYDAAEIILYDLVESGDVALNGIRNPKISGIEFYFGTSFKILIKEDVYISETGEKCEFLQRKTGIELNNFSESHSEAFTAYSDFLVAESNSQNLSNYEEVLLPYAKKSADMLLAQYEIYKNSPEKEIRIYNYGKKISLSADSSLSETYEKIIANLNGAIEKIGRPPITNQVLEISFGGNISWEIVNRWIIIEVSVGSRNYSFYLSFNENGEFSEEYINHFKGTLRTGYEWGNPDMFNSFNEEYAEFFGRLKIEEIDLSDIQSSYGYDGVGCALYCFSYDVRLNF